MKPQPGRDADAADAVRYMHLLPQTRSGRSLQCLEPVEVDDDEDGGEEC